MARCIGIERGRGCGDDPPPCLRRAGIGPRFNPQQQQGHARRLGREYKAATGGQVERARIAPAFDDQHAQTGTAGGISSRTQQRHIIPCQPQHQLGRIKPQLGKARCMQPARTPHRRIGAKPHHHRPRPACPQPQQRGKRRTSRCIAVSDSANLVQTPQGQSTTKIGICRCMSGGEQTRRLIRLAACQTRDALPQNAERGGRLGNNVPIMFYNPSSLSRIHAAIIAATDI